MASVEGYDLTTKQAADILGVHPSTVWRLDREDLYFAKTPGGQRRYKRSDVEAYRASLNPRDNRADEDLAASD